MPGVVGMIVFSVEEGTAVFSRYPITQVDYILLPRRRNDPDDAHQRAVLKVTVHTEQLGPFHVFVSHFALE